MYKKNVILFFSCFLFLCMFTLVEAKSSNILPAPSGDVGGAFDSRAYDNRRIVEKKSIVTSVAYDCSGVVVGESTFVIGTWRHQGGEKKTRFLDSSGRPVKHCALKPNDRVYVRGVARKDGTIFATIIQKR